VLKRPNEGNLDEATQQATAAPVASEKKTLDVQRARIIFLLRSRGVAVRPSWDYLELMKALDPELQATFTMMVWCTIRFAMLSVTCMKSGVDTSIKAIGPLTPMKSKRYYS
jgi:hypothetical protein